MCLSFVWEVVCLRLFCLGLLYLINLLLSPLTRTPGNLDGCFSVVKCPNAKRSLVALSVVGVMHVLDQGCQAYSGAWKFVNPLEFSIFLRKCDLKCEISRAKIWWCFRTYLCRNLEHSKNFQAPLYNPWAETDLINVQIWLAEWVQNLHSQLKSIFE